ncbi:hypothetical protein [Carboxylicivirga sp. M1479]|uniref:hypothetical protein n=1 Tax=Carboxylicivirga sp. M1479 TaxID=2594476 RepID=UPI0011783586|nr:hypothetical protein [Carboxylicivirga sp. M1479]TRX61668.1 hypothetical protein FNN09_20140 [Carboxylicivirga sp. M1479]
MNWWITTIIGLLITAVLFLITIKIWFWIINRKEIIKERRIIANLTENGTDKLTKEQQFLILDGKNDLSMIKTILGKKEIDMNVLGYFIDIMPDDYLNHLRNNYPPDSWDRDMYEGCRVEKDGDFWNLIFYDHGNVIQTLSFDDYDNILKFIVYERLTNISYKYKRRMSKKYYAQQGI